MSALAITAVTGLAISGIPNSNAATTAAPNPSGDISGALGQTAKERPVNYDARYGTTQGRAAAEASIVASRAPGFAAFARSLGTKSLMDYDPLTGTPRNLGRLDGFLTAPSSAPAQSIAMGYVKSHLADLGLTAADLSTFQLRQDYVDISGIHHISWTQTAKGVTVFSNGLKANVTKTGQIISIQGSPISGLASMASSASATPAVSAAEARAKAAADVGGRVAPGTTVSSSTSSLTKWSNRDQAQLVWFVSPSGIRLGWSTYVEAGSTLNYQHVIDATTGRVLYRHDTTNFERGDALVFENYPGAAIGGRQHVVNFYKAKLLPRSQTTWLRGQYVVAWSDVNDDNQVNAGERTRVPGTVLHATGKLVHYNPLPALCSKEFVCTWIPKTPYSWRVNRAADVQQGFYYDSIYHNYLNRAPFGFTSAAGNFELRGGDPVLLNDLDGAAVDNGSPDGGHIDNANMNTPPDGISPTMQMYLFHFPHSGPLADPRLATSSTMDPSVILHEYTHGLSSRLVTDAQGNQALNSIQAGAMGEAWSDYYAMDYLVTKGLYKDTAAEGDTFEGFYSWTGGHGGIRTEAIDCPVQTSAAGCTQPSTGQTGGYTYGDFPTIGGGPEVHASGELWSQTLWDLRGRLGHTQTDSIVTRAMELSPPEPSMLDMRNAIIQANLAVYAGSKTNQIWHTFAVRGMGWFAGTIDGADPFPKENFKTPPAPETPRSTIFGTVKDGITGKPLGGALVAITGHSSGFTGDYSAVTNPDGSYQIPNVFIGTYALMRLTSPGYEVLSGPIKVVAGATQKNFEPRRDWAAANGGAFIAEHNGPDFSPACGPVGAIDLSQGVGWGSTTGDDAGDPTNEMIPKYITIKLPSTTEVTSFAVNPSNTCGDAGSASTAKYKIETSPDGQTWTKAIDGEFTSADRHLNQLEIDNPISGVNYVKFWMLSPQVPDFEHTCPEGNYSGCSFTDMTEIEVFGNS